MQIFKKINLNITVVKGVMEDYEHDKMAIMIFPFKYRHKIAKSLIM